jgi:glycosyltransferase involved in cell wall biosynthesis
LTFGDVSCASSLYRVFKLQGPLKERGISLDVIPANDFTQWESVAKYDLVLVQKKLFRLSQVRFLSRHAKCLLYDLDDAIWHPHGRSHHFFTRWKTGFRLHAIARASALCTAANSVLATELRRWQPNVAIVPMALDEREWQVRMPDDGLRVRLGWSGAPVNLAYLETIAPALDELGRRNPSMELAVVSGRKPQLPPTLKSVHLPWQPNNEAELVRTFDIGLLPLPDNPFAAGKSPVKCLQYMACGIPVVASPLAGVREILEESDTGLFAKSQDDWVRELDHLIKDKGLRHQMGARARLAFERSHSLTAVAGLIAALWREKTNINHRLK